MTYYDIMIMLYAVFGLQENLQVMLSLILMTEEMHKMQLGK